jgi:hypothetical protein
VNGGAFVVVGDDFFLSFFPFYRENACWLVGWLVVSETGCFWDLIFLSFCSSF